MKLYRSIYVSTHDSDDLIIDYLLPKISTGEMRKYFKQDDEDPYFHFGYEILPNNLLISEKAKYFEFDFVNFRYCVSSYSDMYPIDFSDYVNYSEIILNGIEYYSFEWPDEIFE